MIALSDIDWGPINATENDAKFPIKWIEPAEIKNCLDHNCWIVSGEKGSGKSAIQRAIREIHSADYFVTPLVDFDRVTFGVLYENLLHLSKTTKLSKSVTLSNYWQYSIVIELIRACVQQDSSAYGDLLRSGPASRHHEMPLNKRLMTLVEEAWNMVDDFTANRKSNAQSPRVNMLASGGISSDLLHDLSTFPLGPEYDLVKKEFFRRVTERGQRLTLILDGFDTLITSDINAASIDLIFSSLVDAILSLREDKELPTLLGVKALIPHDRFMNLSLRDADKVDALHTAIRWNTDTLRAFVEKRIAITPKVKPGPFQTLWRQILPETIVNPYYKLEEDSFDYILRHTMLRPRQVQIHLGNLANTYRGQNIAPSMVPKSIAESNRKLARFFIGEYVLDHPHLERFILTFEQKDNVMPYSTFRDLVVSGIQRFHGLGSGIDVDEKIDLLYAMGLFGIVRFLEAGAERQDRYYPPTRESKQHYVDFFFRMPESKISARISDDTLIGLHPIFVDYANLRPHPSLIVG